MEVSDITKRFTYYPPTQDQPLTYEDIRDRGLNLALYLNAHCPDSRELSLAITKIEEAVMWANAAVARHTNVE
jgi:hypothetical protein